MSLNKKLQRYTASISSIFKKEIPLSNSVQYLAEQILKGAQVGGELDSCDIGNWIENRLKYQLVWLDKDDYTRALVRALWLSSRFAGTDFGGSRQRDMAQVWTDTARGFLGEIAVSKFLLKKFQIESALDTRRGNIKEFLPTDIAEVQFPGEPWRKPKINISIKTTKFNGRWLDVPGDQINHSDVFILVKVGILREHFLSFLKAISFMRDKLFATAKKIGELKADEAETLWKEMPQFSLIPAYISGYLYKKDINFPIHEIKCRIKGKKNIRISIDQGIGIFSQETLRRHPQIQKLDPKEKLRIEINPIIDSVNHPHFMAHSGGLKWGEKEWFRFIQII